MPRHEWDDLPRGVCDAIRSHAGPLASVGSPPTERKSGLAFTVRARTGQVLLCKGGPLDDDDARFHRHEARIAPYLPLVAPGLIWSLEESGWLINAFEHVEGKHADLSPGSPDLPRVAHAIEGYTVEGGDLLRNAPAHLAPSLAEQWERLAAWRRLAHDTPADLADWEHCHLDTLIAWESTAFSVVDGDALCHTDPHEPKIIVGDTVRVIDWSRSRRAAPLIDSATLVLRLITAGHRPDEAEKWAADVTAWRDATAGAITACAVALLGILEYELRTGPGLQHPALAEAARKWAHHRIRTH